MTGEGEAGAAEGPGGERGSGSHPQADGRTDGRRDAVLLPPHLCPRVPRRPCPRGTTARRLWGPFGGGGRRGPGECLAGGSLLPLPMGGRRGNVERGDRPRRCRAGTRPRDNNEGRQRRGHVIRPLQSSCFCRRPPPDESSVCPGGMSGARCVSPGLRVLIRVPCQSGVSPGLGKRTERGVLRESLDPVCLWRPYLLPRRPLSAPCILSVKSQKWI